MAGQEIEDVKLSTILKILAFLCGIALMAIGITKFTTFAISDPVDFFLSIYYILFGVLVCFSELPFQKILYFFSFLKTFIGKAIFLLFLGTLVFDNAVWWHVLVAIVMWCVAICYFVLAFACKSKLKNPEEIKANKAGKKNDDEGPEEQNSSALKPLSSLEPSAAASSLKPLAPLNLQPAPLQVPVLPPPPPKN
mmetsp:Transcript_25801/g.45479  ORF Transcript_25801/g.45479 Transcript_25801/m.45479 type:complete len:194 (-) Transcript_25801:1398-1979(-)